MKIYKFVCNICGKEIVAFSKAHIIRLASVHKRDKHAVDKVEEIEISAVEV